MRWIKTRINVTPCWIFCPRGAASCDLMIRFAWELSPSGKRAEASGKESSTGRKGCCPCPTSHSSGKLEKECVPAHPSAIYPLWQGENERPISNHTSRAGCSSKLSAPGIHSYQTKSPGSPLEAALGWLQVILTGSQTTEWTNTDILLRRVGGVRARRGGMKSGVYYSVSVHLMTTLRVTGGLFWRGQSKPPRRHSHTQIKASFLAIPNLNPDFSLVEAGDAHISSRFLLR